MQGVGQPLDDHRELLVERRISHVGDAGEEKQSAPIHSSQHDGGWIVFLQNLLPARRWWKHGDQVHRNARLRAKAVGPDVARTHFTGTPIDRAMVNTHREFGPVKDGKQERYLTLLRHPPVHQRRGDAGGALPLPPRASGDRGEGAERRLRADVRGAGVGGRGGERIPSAKEVRWKTLARDPEHVGKIVENMVTHFLEHPDPSGFKAQLVCIDRTACTYKDALDAEFKKRGIAGRCRLVGRGVLRSPERPSRIGALPLRQGSDGPAHRLLQADAESMGDVEPRQVRR